jgi:hypothetical protein
MCYNTKRVCFLGDQVRGGVIVTSEEREVVPGLSSTDVREIADKVFNWTDGNHPQVNSGENGFLDILRNGKSEVSSSPAFIRKLTQ